MLNIAHKEALVNQNIPKFDITLSYKQPTDDTEGNSTEGMTIREQLLHVIREA
jgi:hypothetical protein